MSDCHAAPALIQQGSAPDRDKAPLIALAGQPNMGKSTLFNLLTGLNQHVGNWPGKTVERREGSFSLDGQTCHLVDLPGTYSLTANSPEEVIAREFILREQPDLVVAVVSAANLERSLYLVSELVALPAPLVVALNMMDVAAQEGIHVEVEVLEAALGVPVVPMTATRAAGVRDLLQVIQETLDGLRVCMPDQPEIRSRPPGSAAGDHPPDQRQRACPLPLRLDGAQAAGRRRRDDAQAASQPCQRRPGMRCTPCWCSTTTPSWPWHPGATSGSAGWCAQRCARRASGRSSLTERLDRWAAHPLWGLFILAGILGAGLLADLHDRRAAAELAGRQRGTCDWQALLSELLAGSACLAARPDRGWRDRRSGHGAHLSAHPGDLLCHLCHAGGCRLHGARRLRDGQPDAPDGAARQVLPAALPGLRLQRAGDHGHARDRFEARAPADDPDRAARALHGAHGGGGLPRPGLLRHKCALVTWGLVLFSLAHPGAERYGAQPHDLQGSSARRSSWRCRSTTCPTRARSGCWSGSARRPSSRKPAPSSWRCRWSSGRSRAAEWRAADQLPGALRSCCWRRWGRGWASTGG